MLVWCRIHLDYRCCLVTITLTSGWICGNTVLADQPHPAIAGYTLMLVLIATAASRYLSRRTAEVQQPKVDTEEQP